MVSPVSMQFAVLVVCVSLARCEWVEISQHYHRPRKPTHYANISNGEHGWGQIPTNWHQTPNKYDTGDDLESWSRKPDDIDRKPTSHNLGDNKKITVGPTNAGEDFKSVKTTEIPIAFVKDSPGPTRAIIEKVSNVGSVKRVQLSSTPIKSPTIKTPNVSYRKSDNTAAYNQDSDEFIINANIFKDSYEEVMSTSNKKENNNKVGPNTYVHFTNPDNSQTYSNMSKGTKSKLDYTFNRRVDTLEESIKMNSNITEALNSVNETVKNVRDDPLTTDKVKKNIMNKSNKNSLNEQNDYQLPIEANQDFRYPDDKSSIQINQSNEFKVNTMGNILEFIKVVTDTISKNVRRGVNGKVKYLSELRDSMLQNIKYRIDACWPDDLPTSQRQHGRRSRAAEGTARGHVEFPSSDSALMTISFLTFAVFLIKLVLQVIQAYKNKAMIMAPVMVATAGRRHLARNTEI